MYRRQPPCEAVNWKVICTTTSTDCRSSASLWGCELKVCDPREHHRCSQVSLLVRLWIERSYTTCIFDLPFVSLLVRLWIERNKIFAAIAGTGQPPCEAVNWKISKLAMMFRPCCQPPCEAVNWKALIFLKTVPATELQLPISSTLESGMNRCFQIY